MTTPVNYHQIPLNPKPKEFNNHTFSFTVEVPGEREEVWKWLNTTETFTKGQIWPYRVEFVSPDPQHIPANFTVGVFNVHHGPFLNFAGVLTEIDAPHYRDLQYVYGSYAITQRWIRPTRLQFWLESLPEGGTKVNCQVDSYVKPFMGKFWTFAQKLFWGQFKGLLKRLP